MNKGFLDSCSHLKPLTPKSLQAAMYHGTFIQGLGLTRFGVHLVFLVP